MSPFNRPLKLRGGKLHIFKQPKSKNLFWHTFLNGKYVVYTTKTDSLVLAKPIAETFRDLPVVNPSPSPSEPLTASQ